MWDLNIYKIYRQWWWWWWCLSIYLFIHLVIDVLFAFRMNVHVILFFFFSMIWISNSSICICVVCVCVAKIKIKKKSSHTFIDRVSTNRIINLLRFANTLIYKHKFFQLHKKNICRVLVNIYIYRDSYRTCWIDHSSSSLG